MKCLQKLACDNREIYPEASAASSSDFYVNDYLGGANDLNQALQLQKDFITLLSSGRFHLRKWCSNHPSIHEAVPFQDRETKLPWKLGSDEIVKTLGLLWHSMSDKFQFQVNIDSKKQEVSTKHQVMSVIASTFDPLGFLGPVIVKCKCFPRD
jgi:hypothetical protein